MDSPVRTHGNSVVAGAGQYADSRTLQMPVCRSSINMLECGARFSPFEPLQGATSTSGRTKCGRGPFFRADPKS